MTYHRYFLCTTSAGARQGFASRCCVAESAACPSAQHVAGKRKCRESRQGLLPRGAPSFQALMTHVTLLQEIAVVHACATCEMPVLFSKRSVLFSALYAKRPDHVLLYMRSVRIMYTCLCKVFLADGARGRGHPTVLTLGFVTPGYKRQANSKQMS